MLNQWMKIGASSSLNKASSRADINAALAEQRERRAKNTSEISQTLWQAINSAYMSWTFWPTDSLLDVLMSDYEDGNTHKRAAVKFVVNK
jgi:hypothetical protein